jgi:hypothetical protein
VHVDRHEERETRRIILLLRLSGKNPVVLLGSDAMRRTLPEVEIPRWQRPAEHLTGALKETCGMDTISITSLEAISAESGSERIGYEIMEPCSSQVHAPREKEWVTVDHLDERAFRDPSDLQAVRQAIAQSATGTENTKRGPFATLGWFPDLQRWVQKEIGTFSLHLNGKFRQLTASPSFSLIRFETNGPAVWFKAVGAPNHREYPLTLALARLFPSSLPEIIATRPEWNGWLAREVEGSLLNDSCTPASWEAAAADLAQLQISSLGRSLHLLDPGARDMRAQQLADLVEPFFRAMGEIMERQTEMRPSVLCQEQLRSLSLRVRDALSVLEEVGIPTALGHLDINPWNIVCSPIGSVFLDWAEAFVGHPFLTFEYLREHFRRAFSQKHPQESKFVARYTSLWQAFASERDVRRGHEVAPLAAVFAYTAVSDLWKDPRRLKEPRNAGYLRSLTRRMEREARGLAERSVPCPS